MIISMIMVAVTKITVSTYIYIARVRTVILTDNNVIPIETPLAPSNPVVTSIP